MTAKSKLGLGAALVAVLLAGSCVGAGWFLYRLNGEMSGYRWSDSRVAESKQIGDSIVQALEAHRSDHGRYPDSLGDLVPDYLDEVPDPVAGILQWRYHRFEEPQPRFSLSFPSNSSEYPVCYYDSNHTGWFMDE